MTRICALVTLALATSVVAQKPPFECGARVGYSKLWEHLHARYDADGDGRITKEEYPRGDVRFANFDRNRDGVLSVTDFPAGRHFNSFNPMLARFADSDEDDEVTSEEWRVFAARLDADGDGEPERASVSRAIPHWGIETDKDWDLFLLSFDQDLDGRFTARDLELMFVDLDADRDGVVDERELRPNRRTMKRPDAPPPAVGEDAPDFELPRAEDPERTIRLSAFEGDRPVALVFGSYT